MFNPREHSQQRAFFVGLFVACLLLCGMASAAPSITLSTKTGPPTSRILVSGRGFKPNVGVDIFFDTKDKALVVTNGRGEFHDAGIHAPRSARPGQHWIAALERNDDKGAREPFLVTTDWPGWLFDSSMTGFNPYENVLNSANVSNLRLRWSFSPTKTYAEPPVLAGGRIYVSFEKVQGCCAVLYGMNAASGKRLWRFSSGDCCFSGAAVAGDIVYVPSQRDVSHGGFLYALSGRTGTLIWKRKVRGVYVYNPTVSNGVVYQPSCGVSNVCSLSAWDAKSGTLRWRKEVPGFSLSSPAVSSASIFFTVGLGSKGILYALEASTGSLKWSLRFNRGLSGLTVANGLVYVAELAEPGIIAAVNEETGAIVWSFPAGTNQSGPAIAEGLVYVGAAGTIYALNEADGTLAWQYSMEGAQQSDPVVANGLLYVSSADPDFSLYSIDSRTGALISKYPLFVFWTIVANGTIYATGPNGAYALAPER